MVWVQLQKERWLLEQRLQEIWIRGFPKQEQMGAGKRQGRTVQQPRKGRKRKKTAGTASVERTA